MHVFDFCPRCSKVDPGEVEPVTRTFALYGPQLESILVMHRNAIPYFVIRRPREVEQ